MFTFHRVGWTEEHSGWLCLIETEEQLQKYLEWKAAFIAEAWVDIKNSPAEKAGHCRTALSRAMKTMLDIKMTKEGKSSLSMVECVNFMERTLTATPVKIFFTDGEVYINSSGGYRTTSLRNDHRGVDEEIFGTCKRKDLIFPSSITSDIRVSRWFGGPHFYVSVDGRNVGIGGVCKWNTVQGAEAAMAKLIKRNKLNQKGL